MRIALYDTFPKKLISAELEFIKRCTVVLERLGHSVKVVRTSCETSTFAPDFVLIMHELTPKLTDFFSIGLLWNPTLFAVEDQKRLQNVASWDLAIPVNQITEVFARDLFFPLRDDDVRPELRIYPSCQVIDDLEAPNSGELSLAYVGVHWDTDRHRPLFEELSAVVDLNVYGPKEAWAFLPQCYRGSLPIDGTSLPKALNRHGITLAIHKDSHVREDTPSMRVFEGCAAKSLVITDTMPSLHSIFGSSIHFVDTRRSAKRVASEIAEIVRLANSDRCRTNLMMENSHRIFREKVSLDVSLRLLLEEVQRILTRRRRVVNNQPTISVIIRCGGRSISFLKRAVNSLSRQTYRNISIIFCVYKPLEMLSAFVHDLTISGRFLNISCLAVEGRGSRSNSLWAGLSVVDTPLFAILDDDDELFHDHFENIVPLINDEYQAAFSGSIRIEEENSDDNPYVEREKRKIEHFSDFDLARFLQWENMILSNSFVARTSLLDKEVLVDPNLDFAEDFYLHLMLVAKGTKYRFSQRASAIWNWRSVSRNNSAHASEVSDPRSWQLNAQRVGRRLDRFELPGGLRLYRPSELAPLSDLTYEASLEEGIAFARPGLPSFLLQQKGISGCESFGRWTDSKEIEFKFDRDLPSKFTLLLVLFPYSPWTERRLYISCECEQQELLLTSDEAEEYAIDIESSVATDKIRFQIPNPVKPPGDPRSIAVGFVSLRLVDLRQKPAENEIDKPPPSLFRRLYNSMVRRSGFD